MKKTEEQQWKSAEERSGDIWDTGKMKVMKP